MVSHYGFKDVRYVEVAFPYCLKISPAFDTTHARKGALFHSCIHKPLYLLICRLNSMSLAGMCSFFRQLNSRLRISEVYMKITRHEDGCGVSFCGYYEFTSPQDVSVFFSVMSLKKCSQSSKLTYLFWLFHQCSNEQCLPESEFPQQVDPVL